MREKNFQINNEANPNCVWSWTQLKSNYMLQPTIWLFLNLVKLTTDQVDLNIYLVGEDQEQLLLFWQEKHTVCDNILTVISVDWANIWIFQSLIGITYPR